MAVGVESTVAQRLAGGVMSYGVQEVEPCSGCVCDLVFCLEVHASRSVWSVGGEEAFFCLVRERAGGRFVVGMARRGSSWLVELRNDTWA